MLIDKVNITIDNLDCGSCDVHFIFGDDKIEFTLFYDDVDPIRELIESIVALEEEISNMDFTRFFIDWETHYNEKDYYRKFEMFKDKGKDQLTIFYKYHNFVEGPFETSFKIKYSVFRQAVIDEALALLRKYGLCGYNDSTNIGCELFPIRSLISLLGAKSKLNKEPEYFYSDIFEEIDILRNALLNK